MKLTSIALTLLTSSIVSVYIATTDAFIAQNCIDITLQNEVPTVVTQEQQITFTNYNSNYEVVYSTTTKTVTQSTFVLEQFVTSTCENFDVQAVSSCTDINVHMTDVIILNENHTTTEEFIVQDLTTPSIYTTTTEEFIVQDLTTETIICTTTEDFIIQDLTTSTSNISGDFEGLPVTTTKDLATTTETTTETTTTDLATETAIIGDLEGLPEEPVEEPEVIINEIEPEVVDVVRVNGLEFCEVVGLGDVIANGTQQQFQTCSITVQGAIPDIEHMVSTIIIAPANNEQIVLGTNFTIVIKSVNIEYGFFDDPATLYYLSPQRLNSNGIIQGHNHVAIQKLLGPGVVPSAQNPLFFKGLNDASLDGTLSAEVNGALFTEVGEYRLCTSSASQGHQPVLSPVARRFFQDDCIRFTIV